MRTVAISKKDWKEKYFDALKDLDEREQNWRKVEHMLRSGINRLATLSQDAHQELDKNLHEIRRISHGNNNIDALEKALTSLTGKTNEKNSKTREDTLSQTIQAMSKLLSMDSKQLAAITLHCQKNDTQKALKVLGKSTGATFPSAAPIPNATLATTLLSLLTQLDTHEIDSKTLTQLQHDIQKAKTPIQWRSAIEKVIEQVRIELSAIHNEKNTLLVFIKKLTEQLSGLEKVALTATQNIGKAKKRSATMSDSLLGEMEALSQHMLDSDDIAKIKQQISRHLNSTLKNMQQYFVQETAYLDEAEKTNQALSGQLRMALKEADALRGQLRESQQALSEDVLTGVPNRHAYEERANFEVTRHLRNKQALTYTIWDIDHFKSINDTYGHSAGDKVLKMIAQLLKKSVRQTDFMARIGGEEFVILLIGTSPEEAIKIANTIRKSIETTRFDYKGAVINVTASCGLTYLTATDNVDTLYQRADAALYQAKRGGRNRCISAEMHTEAA